MSSYSKNNIDATGRSAANSCRLGRDDVFVARRRDSNGYNCQNKIMKSGRITDDKLHVARAA